jgi:2-polyprenyl-3-methyl-5-hydroxy-6-metoxy-1,4-benzoquinol methylase
MNSRILINSQAWNKIWSAADDEEFWYWVRREIRGTRGRKVISYIQRHLNKLDTLNIVEVGSGVGVYSFIFAKYGARVTLLDYSQKALLLARRYFDSAGLSASFLYMDALNLNSELIAKFDVAMSFGTIEHYEYPEYFLMAKTHIELVREGGVVIISVPNRLFFPHRALKFYLQKKRSGTWVAKGHLREMNSSVWATD